MKISLADYSDSEFKELVLIEPEECRAHLESDSMTWIHVQGDAAPDTLRQLGKLFGLHHLALEDVINTGQRPKVDDYKDQLFVIVAHPVMGSDSRELTMEQLSIFVGHNFLVSFHPGVNDPFDPIRARLRDHSGRLRDRGADYLLYALIDLVIDEGFPLLETSGGRDGAARRAIVRQPPRADSLQQLHRAQAHHADRCGACSGRSAKCSTAWCVMRAGLSPRGTGVYFRDCYDHAIQIMDLIETCRDYGHRLDGYLPFQRQLAG